MLIAMLGAIQRDPLQLPEKNVSRLQLRKDLVRDPFPLKNVLHFAPPFRHLTLALNILTLASNIL